MPVLERNGVEFGVLDGALRIRTFDYHAGPAHLSHEDLRRLGFALPDAESREESAVLVALAGARRHPHAEPLGPAITDPGWTEPRAMRAGDFRLAPVREGLDVYVDEFDPLAVVLEPAELAELGLVGAG